MPRNLRGAVSERKRNTYEWDRCKAPTWNVHAAGLFLTYGSRPAGSNFRIDHGSGWRILSREKKESS